ncbi:hypothetical protein [Pseudoxanthomonas dokdonensis]|uniref:Uncharacterized protein n=1 Tax=Pseudoxanthomonas dokdonensis TaxID=344882 RepID=A0A0R0CWQ8_9GAMM|nr:hypothetical protein [Pseudoxanthomonas dokdonensis]KRG70164.1 hypothetical protein ABB29_08095 [Pseudoxanthomonas dokdonensis]
MDELCCRGREFTAAGRGTLRAMLLTAGVLAIAAVQAGERVAETARPQPPAKVVHQVHGHDFPLLTRATGAAVMLDAQGLPQQPGCEAIAARRPQDMPAPWPLLVRRILLECEADDEDPARPVVAISATALLEPGRVRMAGFDVSEIRLMDSARWGDHQYVIAQPFARVSQPMQALLQKQCQRGQALPATGSQVPAGCTVFANDQGLYLPADTNTGTGIWVYPDPDNPDASIYAESWAD